MMTLCNWLGRVFPQRTSSLESTTGYRTTKEGFGIYPTRNKSLIFILRTTPHPCQCFRASKIGNGLLPPQLLAHTESGATSHFRCMGETCRKIAAPPLTVLVVRIGNTSFINQQSTCRIRFTTGNGSGALGKAS